MEDKLSTELATLSARVLTNEEDIIVLKKDCGIEKTFIQNHETYGQETWKG